MPKSLVEHVKGVLSWLPHARFAISREGWGRLSSRLKPPSLDLLGALRSREIERRQLSVLFCDLVGSTDLSRSLDPEDFHDVLNDYHRLARETIARHDGYTAQFLGDGVLAYFGFPNAHEDDAARAVRAGLELCAAAETLSDRLRARLHHDLRIRVGIHAGLVVVGDVGDPTRAERLAIGEVPNVAAKAQHVAAPNTVVVTDTVCKLVKGQFEFAALPPGSSPFELFQVRRETRARQRLEWAGTLTRFVDRETELAALAATWRRAEAGAHVAVAIHGEPGSGKSRLVREFCDALGSVPIIDCSCSTRLANSPFYPLIEAIARQATVDATQPIAEQGERLARWLNANRRSPSRALPVLSSLLLGSESGRDTTRASALKERREAMEVLYATLLPSRREPCVLVVDDVQWADPSSLEFLINLLRRSDGRGVLVLLTARTGFQHAIFDEPELSLVKLSSLEPEHSQLLIAALTELHPIPRELLGFLVQRSNGLPLFLEELTHHLLDSGMLVKTHVGYQLRAPLSDISVPSSIQGFLTEKLDRLGYDRMLVQAAAVIGLDFDAGLLARVVREDPVEVQRTLTAIGRTAVVLDMGEGHYAFRHALIREAAYQMLSRERRREYHSRVAQLLPQTAAYSAHERPEVLAYHYAGAGDAHKAAEFWLLAGTRAVERYALLEAMDAFQRGLQNIAQLASSCERDVLEAELLTGLGFTYSATKGFSANEVEEIYTRARKLCAAATNPPMRVMFGMWAVHIVRGDIEATATIADYFRSVVRNDQSSADERLVAHACLGTLHFYLGEIQPSIAHFEAGIALCDVSDPKRQNARLMAAHGFDGLLFSHLYLLWVVAFLDQPERLAKLIEQSLDLTVRLESPFATAMTSMYLAHLGRDIGDRELARVHAVKAIELSSEYGYPFWLAGGLCVAGWLAIEDGNAELGLSQIQQAIDQYDSIGACVAKPYYLSYLVDAYLRLDRLDDADRVADQALKISENNVGKNYVVAILHLKGKIARKQGRTEEARQYLEFARELARSQGVLELVRRISISLEES